MAKKLMVKILVNDGIHPDGRLLLEEANYLVDEDKIAQEDLVSRIGEYDVLIVRSATKVTKAVIDAGKNLKIIARGSQLWFIANGVLLGTATHTARSAGSVDIHVTNWDSDAAEYEFKNLIVRAVT